MIYLQSVAIHDQGWIQWRQKELRDKSFLTFSDLLTK